MLFRKLIILAAILIIIEGLVNRLVIQKYLPAFWGNEEVFEKINYVKKYSDINTVFVGSSKIKRQIIPQVFDSITGNSTHSFNLGCNALFIPESFMVLDYLLDSTTVKNIIYEVRPVYHIYPENLHITRTAYYLNRSNYLETISNSYHSNLPLSRKATVFSTFTVAYLEKIFNFNLSNGYIDYKNYDLEQTNKIFSASGGYMEMGKGTSITLSNSAAELYNRAAFSNKYMSEFKTGKIDYKLNSTYYDELERLADKAAQKHVKLTWLFPTSLREFEYKEILPLLNKINKHSKIITLGVDSYPQFYQLKYNYETEHLNTEGAYLFSTVLADLYNKENGK